MEKFDYPVYGTILHMRSLRDGSRPCRVRVIFRPLSQAAWIVRISRSSVRDRGFQDLLQPCCLDRTHTCPTCITIMLFANSLHRMGL